MNQSSYTHYVYDSNGQDIPFYSNQVWHSSNSETSSHKCVLQSDENSKWFDRSCSERRQSICEINLLNISNSCEKPGIHQQVKKLQTSIITTKGKKKKFLEFLKRIFRHNQNHYQNALTKKKYPTVLPYM